jgi:nitrogen fixation-related uncharacterized protein
MNPSLSILACFFCGVDSKALLYFFLVFVISIVLSSAAFLFWAMSRGDFKSIENAKYDVFNDPEAGTPGSVSIQPLANSEKP